MSPVIRRIAQGDVVAGFRSGEKSVDRYLKQFARLNEEERRSANFVAVEGNAVVGFVTVVGSVVPQPLIAGIVQDLPRYDAPVLLLAQMAVRVDRQKSGVGRALMRTVYEEADAHTAHGCVGVVTDALPGAVAYYLKRGFATIAPPTAERRTTYMFRSLASILTELRVSMTVPAGPAGADAATATADDGAAGTGT